MRGLSQEMKFFNGEFTYSTSYLKDSGFRTVSGESIMPRRDDDDDDYGVFMKGGGDATDVDGPPPISSRARRA